MRWGSGVPSTGGDKAFFITETYRGQGATHDGGTTTHVHITS